MTRSTESPRLENVRHDSASDNFNRRILGSWLRRFFHDGLAHLRHVAERLRYFGLDWNRSQLAKAERGERALTFEQVVVIAATLDVPLADLVRGDPDEWVALTPDATIDHEGLAAVVDGTDVQERMRLLHAGHYQQSRRLHDEQRRLEAEARFASPTIHLDIAEEIVQERYGHPFIIERERRVAARLGREPIADPSGADVVGPLPGVPAKTLAAVRGHVTRELSDEVGPEVARRHAAMASKTQKAKTTRTRASKGRKR